MTDNDAARAHFENGPAFRKPMVVATPFGEYVNGDDEGDMTPERLKAIAKRFKKYPRQVPVFAMGDHEFDLDSRPVDGWVEGLEYHDSYPGYPDGALVADVKANGEAARLLIQDRVRGASIGTVKGVNPDGSAQGEVLQHLLLTNHPFDKSLNIAAARKGGEPVVSYFTALQGDKDMADDQKKNEETIAALTKRIEELEAAPADPRVETLEAMLKTKARENEELVTANEGLKADIARFQKNPQLEEAIAKLKRQDRQLLAMKVRRLMAKGVAEGRFNAALAGTPAEGWDAQSDEIVLSWFGASKFEGSIDRLEFALATFERKPTNQKFNSGLPLQNGERDLTAEEREAVRKLGMNPEAVVAGMRGDIERVKELNAAPQK